MTLGIFSLILIASIIIHAFLIFYSRKKKLKENLKKTKKLKNILRL